MSRPPGTSANVRIPPIPIQVKVGYGMLLDAGETTSLSIAMKREYARAKAEGEFGIPISNRLDEGLLRWYFARCYPSLAPHSTKVQNPFTGEISVVFAIVDCDIHRSEKLNDILKKYDYNLPSPSQEVQDDLEAFKKEFNIIDDIDWTHWK